MIANFCKTGPPSADGIEWSEYNNDIRKKGGGGEKGGEKEGIILYDKGRFL